MPKMVTFTGKSNWETFIFQFERTAKRCDWRPNKKAEKVLDCLAEQALDYAQHMGALEDFDHLKEALGAEILKKGHCQRDQETALPGKATGG